MRRGGSSRRAPRQPYFYRRDGNKNNVEYIISQCSAAPPSPFDAAVVFSSFSLPLSYVQMDLEAMPSCLPRYCLPLATLRFLFRGPDVVGWWWWAGGWQMIKEKDREAYFNYVVVKYNSHPPMSTHIIDLRSAAAAVPSTVEALLKKA